MPITTNDIKLMKSERLTDDADGGGRMSGNEVVDGVSNNLFPDIATLDRINGRVFLRKVFPALLTTDTESLLGAHAIIVAGPTDPAVSAVMYTTGSHTDERAAAAESLEANRYSTNSADVLQAHTVTASTSSSVTVSDAAPIVGGVYRFATTGNTLVDVVYVTGVTGAGPWVATFSPYSVLGPNAISTFGIAKTQPGRYGISPLAATVSSGSVLTVGTVNERISPKYDGVDQNLVKFNPANLPDGRAPIFAPGSVVVVHHTDEDTMPNPLSAGQVVNLSRATLARCILVDQEGDIVATDKYTVNLTTGQVTMATPLDLSAYTQPLIARHRIEQMFRLTAVNNATKQLTVAGSVTRTFPANETLVSSALYLGDLKARVLNVLDQQTWTGVWSDGVIGSGAPATYNHVTYPITVTNKGAIKERWAVEFTGATAFRVIGETVGQIAVGSTGTLTAPINPTTGEPYFAIPALGWGSGWSSGNALRFNTEAAAGPVWIDRCVNLGEPQASDLFSVEIRGDINA